MRRAMVVTAFVAALSTPMASAVADDTVVVPGTAFPSTETYLSYFGCGDLFHTQPGGPLLRINQEAAGPAGARSFGLLPRGTGTASGPIHRVESVAATTVSGLSVRAPAGTAGVGYVWYVAPGLVPGQAWAGRADLSVGAGGWQQVDARAASYTWKLYNALTGAVVRDGGAASIADFTAANGDGPGYLLAGFGCDGREFNIDALRYGAPGSVTTYDLEGISVSTGISASAAQTAPGRSVTLTGSSVRVDGRRVAAPLVLESRPAGSAAFAPVGEPVQARPDGMVVVAVTPEVTTQYRWFFPVSGYADAGWSEPVLVKVLAPPGGGGPGR